MDLIKHYLDEVVKVHGVYVLRVPDETTLEEMHLIHESWKATGTHHHLFIMPKEFEMSFITHYSLYIALMLVRAGQHVTRERWISDVVLNEVGGHPNPAIRRERVKHKAPYLKLNEHGDLIKYYPETQEEMSFNVDDYAMDAEDYILLAKPRE